MDVDFNSRAEMYAYTERRVVVDTDKYAKYFLNMGDIFRESAPGVYNANTGEQLVDFIQGGHFMENGKRVRITCWKDFEEANGDIFNHNNMLTVRHRNIKRITVTERAPLFHKAVEAAAATFGDLLKANFRYAIVGRNIRDLRDIVYMDDIEESDRRLRIMQAVENDMVADMANDFKDIGWKELLLSRKTGTYMVDVLMDVRLKEYYENKFDRMDREDDERREREYEGGIIRNP